MFDTVDIVFSSSLKLKPPLVWRFCFLGLRLLVLVDAVVVIVATLRTCGAKTFNSYASILVWTAISRLFFSSFSLFVATERISSFEAVFKSSASVSLKALLLLLLLFVLLFVLRLVVLRPLTNLLTLKSSLSVGDDFEIFELVSVGVEVCLFVLVFIILLLLLLLFLTFDLISSTY